MRRFLTVLLGLAVSLTACTPAASETTSEAPATVETAPVEAAEEPSAPPVGMLTMNINAREDATGYYMMGTWKNPDTGERRRKLYRLDYATGQKKMLYDFGSYDSGEVLVADPFVQGNAVYVQGDTSLYRLPLEGGEMEVHTLDQSVWCGFSDENACYQLVSNLYSNDIQPTVQRVDLKTGTVTQWKLPAMYIHGVYDCRGDRVFISRVVTDQPLSYMEDMELFHIVLQNAVMEYDWLDLATGELEKVLEQPYIAGPDENGQTSQWTYLGMTEDSIYFRHSVTDEQGAQLSRRLERCAMDGSGMETVMPLDTSNTLYPVNRDTQLVWLLDYDYTGPATIYDVERGKVYENIPIQGNDSGWPAELTGDGRVLVNDHYNEGAPTYALIGLEEYLSGSRDWTLFTDAEN